MSIKPRTAPKRGGRRQLRNPKPEVAARLLEAAADLTRDESFPQLRVEEIVDRANVSVGTFYLYFDGKEDLFVQLVVEYTERLRSRLSAAYALDGSYVERMQAALDAYLDFVEENESAFLHFRDSGTVDTTVGRLSTWAIDEHVNDLRPAIEEAMARGEIRDDDSTMVAQATLGVVQHLAGFWLDHRDRCSRQELQRFINQLLMFGLSAWSPQPGDE